MGNSKNFAAALAAAGSVTALSILLCWTRLSLGLALLIGTALGALTAYLGYKPAETWLGTKRAWRFTSLVARRELAGFWFWMKVAVSTIGRFIAGAFRYFWSGHVAALFAWGMPAMLAYQFYVNWLLIPSNTTNTMLIIGGITVMAVCCLVYLLVFVGFMFLVVLGLTGASYSALKHHKNTVVAKYLIAKASFLVNASTNQLSEDRFSGIYFGDREYGFTLARWGFLWLFNVVGVVYLAAILLYAIRVICIAVSAAILRFGWGIVCLLGTFVRNLNRNIHSEMRTMALVDGPVGGLLAFLIMFAWRGDALLSDPIAEQLIVVGLGAVCALLLGYFNCLLVASRGLGIVPRP